MWNPSRPEDLSQFRASDLPDFMAWWETQLSESMALALAGAFVEGATLPYLELMAAGEQPDWVRVMLQWRLSAQWAYQQGESLSSYLVRNGLYPIGFDGVPDNFRVTPAQLAEIPPQMRQAFIESMRFGMGWVTRLNADAREQTRALVAIAQLANRNPTDVAPLLEQVLRRQLAGGEELVDEWVEQASEKVLSAIANRAQTIARTEGARAQNLGILESMILQGDAFAYVMPHRGTCPECRRLLDGRVFRVELLKRNMFANFHQPKARWVAALPQHPNCRHSPMKPIYKFRKALSGVEIPERGILLKWYGLPGGKDAMNALALRPQEDAPGEKWLTIEGKFEYPSTAKA